MTTYNNRLYTIDGLTFDVNPKSYHFKWTGRKGSDGEGTMLEYFTKMHNIKTIGDEEPLLFID